VAVFIVKIAMRRVPLLWLFLRCFSAFDLIFFLPSCAYSSKDSLRGTRLILGPQRCRSISVLRPVRVLMKRVLGCAEPVALALRATNRPGLPARVWTKWRERPGRVVVPQEAPSGCCLLGLTAARHLTPGTALSARWR